MENTETQIAGRVPSPLAFWQTTVRVLNGFEEDGGEFWPRPLRRCPQVSQSRSPFLTDEVIKRKLALESLHRNPVYDLFF